MSEQKLTGYPSIDKPWLKYYTKEAINAPLPECGAYEIIFKSNQDNLGRVAIEYYGRKVTYGELFANVDTVSDLLVSYGVKSGDIVSLCALNSVETIYLIYALNKIGAVSNLICGLDSDRDLVAHLKNSTVPLLFTLDIFAERIASLLDQVNLSNIVVFNLTQSMPFVSRFVARKFKGMRPKHLPNDRRFVPWDKFIASKTNAEAEMVALGLDAPATICSQVVLPGDLRRLFYQIRESFLLHTNGFLHVLF